MKQNKLLLVEDTPSEAYYIEEALKSRPEWTLESRASNGKMALSILKRKKFELVLLDLFMPVMDGFETLAAIRQLYPHQKVLVISSYNSESISMQLLKLGANGFSSKLKECFIPAIESCIESGLAFDKRFVILQNPVHQENKPDYPEIIFSERDLQIIKCLAKGLQTEEISTYLNLSPRSIETYIRNILNKLELKNRVQLISFAYENGLLP